jgi:hypothetical protein
MSINRIADDDLAMLQNDGVEQNMYMCTAADPLLSVTQPFPIILFCLAHSDIILHF